MNKLIFQLINQASHPNTSDNEALAFMRKVRSILDRENKDFMSLMVVIDDKPLVKPEFRSFVGIDDENKILREKVDALTREVEMLAREHTKAEAIVERKKKPDGTMPYMVFNLEIAKRHGALHGAKTAFARHFARISGNPDFREQHIDVWKSSNVVPVEAVAALTSFKAGSSPSVYTKPSLVNDLLIWKLITVDGMTEHPVARRLDQSFGSIKKARQRMRLREQVLIAYRDGHRDVSSVLSYLSPKFLFSVSGNRTTVSKMIDEIKAGLINPDIFKSLESV